MNHSGTISVLYEALPCSDGVRRTVWYDARGAEVYVVIGARAVHGRCVPPWPAAAERFVALGHRAG